MDRAEKAFSSIARPSWDCRADADRDLERQLGEAEAAAAASLVGRTRPDVVCPQETKLADEALVELLGGEPGERRYELAAPQLLEEPGRRSS